MSQEQSTFFSTVSIEDYASVITDSDGDLWPAAWSDDNHIYAANGDGKGFDLHVEWRDIVINKITGHPEDGTLSGEKLTGEVGQIWSDAEKYNRKPTGMVSVKGTLYLAVQDLNKTPGPDVFNDAPAASILKSVDKGRTWGWNTDAPMFDHHVFTTIMFLDYGRDSENAIDGYVYAYGMDYNWRDSFSDSVTDPTMLYLARVPQNSVQDRTRWEFFTGSSGNHPQWSQNIADKQPVLTDDRRIYKKLLPDVKGIGDMTVISQGSVVYNKPINRYIYSSWTEYTFEFYEAPSPWGPWKKFLTKDFGTYPWSGGKYGGYAATIPSKFISDDGKTMYVQSCTFVGGINNYRFNLRKLLVEPFTATFPCNTKGNSNMALEKNTPGVVPICKSAHYGNLDFLNDGKTGATEDSRDGEDKTTDWWGYTWPNNYNMNKLVYTIGNNYGDEGGWFTDMKVEVRQNFQWKEVQGLSISPQYPFSSLVANPITYTLIFEATWGDGIRIIGTPGGKSKFTAISELEVYFV